MSQFDFRFGTDSLPPKLAGTRRNWLRSRPEVILAQGSLAAWGALLQATRAVPIVFVIVA